MNSNIPTGLKKLIKLQASRSVYFSTKFVEYIEPIAKIAPLNMAQKKRVEIFYSYILSFRNRLIDVYLSSDKKKLGSLNPYLLDQKLQKSLKTEIAHQSVDDRYDLAHRADLPSGLVDECVDIINLLNNPENHDKNDIPDGDVWITKGLDGRFYFKGKPMRLTKTALYFKLFSIVFDELGKRGGAISYDKIMSLSRGKISEIHTTKNRTRAKIIISIRNALTGKQNGFFRASRIPKAQQGILKTLKNEEIVLFGNKR